MISAALGYYFQNISHRGKRHISRLLLKAFPVCSVRGFYGVIMAPDANDKTCVYGLSGEYGRTVSDHLLSIPDGSVFIDIGTNHGVFSLMVAKNIPNGAVVSFEPNPAIYKKFLHNIYLNRLNNIVPFHAAVGPQEGLIGLSYDPSHSGKAYVSKDMGALKVPVLNLAHLSVLDGIVKDKDIHIKIDVEGYEADVIGSLLESPWFTQVKSMVVEIDEENLKSFGHTPKEIYDSMGSKGFVDKFGTQHTHYDEIFYR